MNSLWHGIIPALFTNMVTVPTSCLILLARALTSSSLDTSHLFNTIYNGKELKFRIFNYYYHQKRSEVLSYEGVRQVYLAIYFEHFLTSKQKTY